MCSYTKTTAHFIMRKPSLYLRLIENLVGATTTLNFDAYLYRSRLMAHSNTDQKGYQDFIKLITESNYEISPW